MTSTGRALEISESSGCACGRSPSPPRSGAARHLTLLPAVVLVLLPKCPLCLMVWLGALSSLGVSSWVSGLWGAPLAIGLLALTASALVLRARRSRDWGPVLVGLLGSGALLAGKLWLDAPPLLYAGLSLLVVASILSNRLVPLPATTDRIV
jgi:hypothetical protein